MSGRPPSCREWDSSLPDRSPVRVRAHRRGELSRLGVLPPPARLLASSTGPRRRGTPPARKKLQFHHDRLSKSVKAPSAGLPNKPEVVSDPPHSSPIVSSLTASGTRCT